MTSDKEEFISICNRYIERKGIDKLLEWLESQDFYVAPASSKFHGSYEGGLCRHSLNVFYALKKLCEEKFNMESVAIVSLFHDICKVNFYKKGFRNVKENNEWVKKEIYEIDEKLLIGYHADKSIFILQMFMELNVFEIQAIRSHMGGFDECVKGGSSLIGKIFDENELAVLLHCADLISSYTIEKK